MSPYSEWSRRKFLQTGFALPFALRPFPSFGAQPVAPVPAGAPAARGSRNERRTFLFLDWFHVRKGDLQITLDPQRMSGPGEKLWEKYAREFDKTYEKNGHGTVPVDTPFGIRIVQEVAGRTEPWLLADQPWEKSINSPTVLFDEGRYRCWYSVRLPGEPPPTVPDQERRMDPGASVMAYAESDDGRRWTKPALGLQTFAGSRQNNVVSPWNKNTGSVFRDDHGPASERYKTFFFDQLAREEKGADGNAVRYGLYGLSSPDGYTWRLDPRPLVKYFADTVNVAARDPLLGKYVGYFRHHQNGRAISRAETDDFWHWPPPQPLLCPGPLEAPADDYYTNCYTTYPDDASLRILFPAIYHRASDRVDVRMAVSRDGRSYHWLAYEPIIPLGEMGKWDGGSLYAMPNLLHLPDGRLAVPLNGWSTRHNEIQYRNFYDRYDVAAGIAWAVWPDARLAGIQAGPLGEFTTNSAPFRATAIQINARATGGASVEVELRARGRPLPGFSFAESIPFRGDALWAPCRWRDSADVSALRGKDLSLRVRLRHAKIFAYRYGD